MSKIHVQIAGVTPLLVNRFHEEAQMEASSGVHGRKEQMTPEEDAEGRLYRTFVIDEMGNKRSEPYFPSENIRQSIIAAASRTKIGRRNASTDTAAALFITPFALNLYGSWVVDTRPVVIPATRGRILRHRPRFDEWMIPFELQVEDQLLSVQTIRKIVDDAGNYVGIGDFRPARKGPYGRFVVTQWEKL